MVSYIKILQDVLNKSIPYKAVSHKTAVVQLPASYLTN